MKKKNKEKKPKTCYVTTKNRILVDMVSLSIKRCLLNIYESQMSVVFTVKFSAMEETPRQTLHCF